MTDLYGVRVLAADHAARTLRIRVSVIYYDSDTHAPLTDDASFFSRLLRETAWDGAPLCAVTTRDQYLDEEWVDRHTRWFVERVERLTTRNHPWPPAELLDADEEFDEEGAALSEADGDEHDREDEDAELPWPGYIGFPWDEGVGFQDLEPDAAAELLRAEEMRVGADYEVVVSDARWMRHLSEGDWWRTAAYPTHADMPLPGEAPVIPDLRGPRAVLKPPGTAEVSRLGFSGDGSRLTAALDGRGESVVYDTADWTECPHASPEEPADRPHGVTSTADGSRMFAARGECVHVLDPADGRTLDTIGHHVAVQSVQVSPDGEHLAVIGEFAEITIRRVRDHRVVTNHRNREGRLCRALASAWSPDGRHLAVSLRVLDERWGPVDGEIRVYGMGLATEPPAALLP